MKKKEDAVTKSGVPGWLMIKCHTLDFLNNHLVMLLATPIKPGDGHGCCNSDTLDFLSWKLKMLLLLQSRFSRVRLCDSIDGSPAGSPVPGILQARILKWVAISFSNA